MEFTDSGLAHSAGGLRYDASRRDFFRAAGMLGLGAAVGLNAQAQSAGNATNIGQNPTVSADEIPRRPLGRHTDVPVSILGMGGHHLGDIKTADEATELIHEAVDGGITLFDNAWEYYNGECETRLGRGLKGRRDKVFLVTKVCTHGRGAQLAMRMLEESLQRLQTDHLDLWQIHAISYDNDPELAYAKGGVLEAFDQAKRDGKVRFVGFTGHKDPAFHLRVLELGYPFDTVQMPLNCFDGTYRSFEQQVLPELQQRGIAALGMKSLGGDGQPLLHGIVTPEEALRYAMSLPVATTISGVDSLSVLRQNLAIARGFQPMTPEAMQRLRERCAPFAADGHLELYKATKKYDADVGRQQHGYPSRDELPM